MCPNCAEFQVFNQSRYSPGLSFSLAVNVKFLLLSISAPSNFAQLVVDISIKGVKFNLFEASLTKTSIQ